MTGCAVTRGQETVGAYIDDTTITTQIKARMVDDKTVDAAAIAERGRELLLLDGQPLDLALHAIDGALRCAARARRRLPREAAAKHDTGGLRQDGHVLAEQALRHLQHGGFARARPAGEHDEARLVPRRLARTVGRAAIQLRHAGILSA